MNNYYKTSEALFILENLKERKTIKGFFFVITE